MKGYDSTPLACSLTTTELRDREGALFARFRSAVIETEELQGGYAFRLPGDAQWIGLIAELIVTERECCPFLAFEVATLPNMGPIIVRMIGPAGTKEFLRTILLPTATHGMLDELSAISEVMLDSSPASELSITPDKSKTCKSDS
jgi:hypothetical protein